MRDVEFSEEKDYAASLRDAARQGGAKRGLTSWIIRKGFAKDETGAVIILGGIALLAVLLTIVVFAFAR